MSAEAEIEAEWDPSIRLVDRLLEEQRMLSAVDEFAAYHEQAEHDKGRYEALLPSGTPGEGEQFAFRVDLDLCTGCKACVTACHSLNGLDEEEAWRRVGMVETPPERPAGLGVESKITLQQTVTTACHHCEDPACLAGCPVRAYDKDPITGIVRHLDDQCIGCRYCQLMCPYDVPQYSERLGIVRKCDLCRDRLSEGEAPACVQGCPNEAISIAIVGGQGRPSDGSEVVGGAARLLGVPLGAMPESSWTHPTTQYVSRRSDLERLHPVDQASVEPSEAHGPLAVMLVLSQVAIGMVCVDFVLGRLPFLPEANPTSSALVIALATLLGLSGLGSSMLHLGRPRWAFRAVLGLRTSWMSREIVVLGGFAGLLLVSCGLGLIDWAVAEDWLGPDWRGASVFRFPVLSMTAACGLLGLYCSTKIYSVTGRPLWRFDRTATRFSLTAIWAGIGAAGIGLSVGAESAAISPGLAQVVLMLGLIGLTKFRIEVEEGSLVRSDCEGEEVAMSRTRALLDGELALHWRRRKQLLVVAGLVFPLLQIAAIAITAPLWVRVAFGTSILAMGTVSDLLERRLFFRSEAMPSMPGVG